jgi:hypothetical protein
MRYHALACDYDGTLASHGIVDEATLGALERLQRSGRRLILVTGRELPDLLAILPRPEMFERVVAENGGLLYRPSTREEVVLAEPPPEKFLDLLKQKGVSPLSVGKVIVATWEPNETAVLDAIRTLGLELQVIFNKGAVMVLPSGINKASGLRAAVAEMKLSVHNVVAVGDAENDHAFLSICECAAAVGNAVPLIKERADIVTSAGKGAGVVELIDQMIASDLKDIEPRLARHEIPVGRANGVQEVRFKPYGENIMIAGTSGGGKSMLARGVLERFCAQGYQFCIIDPEGDYRDFDSAIAIGDEQRTPSSDDVTRVLGEPNANVVVNLLGIRIEDRPSFFDSLLPRLQQLRAQTGRPHWIVIDETHHLLPPSWEKASETVPQELSGFILITVHPDHVSKIVLSAIDTFVLIGESPEKTICAVSEALGRRTPPLKPLKLEPGEALLWRPGAEQLVVFRTIPAVAERRRHRRKYAFGELGEDRSFYFEGPEHKLHLRAQNLTLFLQIGRGVDDETWMYHLKRGDYSRWFRDSIKDEELAAEAAAVEQNGLPPAEARSMIEAAINKRYTALE